MNENQKDSIHLSSLSIFNKVDLSDTFSLPFGLYYHPNHNNIHVINKENRLLCKSCHFHYNLYNKQLNSTSWKCCICGTTNTYPNDQYPSNILHQISQYKYELEPSKISIINTYCFLIDLNMLQADLSYILKCLKQIDFNNCYIYLITYDKTINCYLLSSNQCIEVNCFHYNEILEYINIDNSNEHKLNEILSENVLFHDEFIAKQSLLDAIEAITFTLPLKKKPTS